MRSAAIRDVIRAYEAPVVRACCWGRFWILRERFLDEIGQYLPARGRVLDWAADLLPHPHVLFVCERAA